MSTYPKYLLVMLAAFILASYAGYSQQVPVTAENSDSTLLQYNGVGNKVIPGNGPGIRIVKLFSPLRYIIYDPERIQDYRTVKLNLLSTSNDHLGLYCNEGFEFGTGPNSHAMKNNYSYSYFNPHYKCNTWGGELLHGLATLLIDQLK